MLISTRFSFGNVFNTCDTCIISSLIPVFVEISNEEKLYTLEDEEPFTITMDGKTYVVNGPAVEKLMKRVNLNDNESMYYFHKTLDELGVSQRLKEMGIKDGDSVTIAGWELEWED